MSVADRLRRAHGRWRALHVLADLSADERQALAKLAATQARENLLPRRQPGIDSKAIISPLASIRFAERVSVGPRAVVGPWCAVWGGWSQTWARIEEGALLSPGVVLVAGNHGMAGTGPIRDQPFEELDVEIGAGAWIGAHAVVIGCRVGRGAVVGAGAVVTKDVPDFAIAVGSPARVVGQRSEADG